MGSVLELMFGSDLSVVVSATVMTLMLFGAAVWGMGREDRRRQKKRRPKRPRKTLYVLGVAVAAVEGAVTVIYWFRDEYALCWLFGLLTAVVGGCTQVLHRRRVGRA
ncbi:hypothetical protein [Streptomyces sp. NBC_01451]|uniref:hypothetical protein n=1 Tax=Streptomyces sp. NBC_01451 TaxID=2903872 RepID=UPI002E324C33|nr:hypothetical protein [Streptomyces sp. NBC_01451]